jgi:hypothetical protein
MMDLAYETLRLDGERRALQRQLAAVEADVQRRVDERVRLLVIALGHGLHLDHRMAPIEIMRATISHLDPGAHLDGADDEFVRGAFASVAEER